jgi:hypothetical protein
LALDSERNKFHSRGKVAWAAFALSKVAQTSPMNQEQSFLFDEDQGSKKMR